VVGVCFRKNIILRGLFTIIVHRTVYISFSFLAIYPVRLLYCITWATRGGNRCLYTCTCIKCIYVYEIMVYFRSIIYAQMLSLRRIVAYYFVYSQLKCSAFGGILHIISCILSSDAQPAADCRILFCVFTAQMLSLRQNIA
jgi:hypothetical protein